MDDGRFLRRHRQQQRGRVVVYLMDAVEYMELAADHDMVTGLWIRIKEHTKKEIPLLESSVGWPPRMTTLTVL